MLRFILTKLVMAAAVALTVSIVSFGLVYMSGDPAIALAGETASDAEVQLIREQYGFDRPIPVQYLDWLVNAVQGDFGVSHYYNMPVSTMILDRLDTGGDGTIDRKELALRRKRLLAQKEEKQQTAVKRGQTIR